MSPLHLLAVWMPELSFPSLTILNKIFVAEDTFSLAKEHHLRVFALTCSLEDMWTDGWLMSGCAQDSQKVCTKPLTLPVPDKAKKLNF